ncbi:MAG TPA: hypothetical protein VHG29_10255 [Novosphingobium sp.]|nr:hypothetical protein [Novosphingobium sp.]
MRKIEPATEATVAGEVTPPLQPLCYTIAETQALTKLSRSYVNSLLKQQRLASVVLGRRRLILADSVHRLFGQAG